MKKDDRRLIIRDLEWAGVDAELILRVKQMSNDYGVLMKSHRQLSERNAVLADMIRGQQA